MQKWAFLFPRGADGTTPAVKSSRPRPAPGPAPERRKKRRKHRRIAKKRRRRSRQDWKTRVNLYNTCRKLQKILNNGKVYLDIYCNIIYNGNCKW